MRGKRRVFAIVAAVTVAIGTAWAQDLTVTSPNYVDSWYQSHIMRWPGPDGGKGGVVPTPAPDAASSDPYARLAFTPSPEGTAAVDAAFADILSGQRSGIWPEWTRRFETGVMQDRGFVALLARQLGTDREAIRRALRTGVLREEFARLLSTQRVSAWNFGDAQNAFAVYAWSVVKGDVRQDRSAALRAMQRTLRGNLVRAKNPPPVPSPAESQEMAEAFAILTTLILRAWEDARDPAERTRLQDGVQALGLEFGYDFRRVVVTDRGMMRR
jgi:hypothetical protein